MLLRKRFVALIAAALISGHCLAGSLPLDENRVAAKNSARVNSENGIIHLSFDDPSRESGVVIEPKSSDAPWDFSRWDILAADVENLSDTRQMRLLLQITAPAPDGKTRDANMGIALNPGEKRAMRLKLPHAWRYGAPEGVPGIRVMDTTKVSKISFFMQWPFEQAAKGLVDCRIGNVRLEGELTPTAPLTAQQYIPFIDEYGQSALGEWPTKIHSSKDLHASHKKEQAELAASKRPDEWNRYGGWKNGPKLKATGNFRTEKYQGKWYLVDPDGRLFFSHGMDVISKYNDPLRVMPGRENWFRSIPQGAQTFLPTENVLREKYGTEAYHAQYFDNLVKRMEHWGFNSIGNWSSHDLIRLGNTPYTLQLTDYDWKMPRLGKSKLKFYDVFDPAYIAKMKTLLQDQAEKHPAVAKSLSDPMCIGYFIDNELDFGNRGRLALTDEVLKCAPQQASKQELVKDLKAKYQTIEALNTAWATGHADWDALLASTDVPTTTAYKADSDAFLQRAVDQYFRLAQAAVKSVAPHRLYLGCRFISTDAVRPRLANPSKTYCDVLTVNVYSHSTANFPVENFPDMPVLIGEFHFGVLDRGMFSASLCQAGVTQEDRALAYTRFMQGALVHPNIVGTHWFQYRDQPLTGRGDGEAYQIGFVDVADVPYEELCRAARAIGEQMYSYRAAGKLR